ncbi:MAG TPA: hypothetical protein VMZ00_09925 [Sporichthya sp.]|nr:hypothetical protein [Sporichthya sp.]
MVDQLNRAADRAVTDRLLRAAGQGNRTAFAGLVDRTARVVFGCLHGALADPAEAGRAAEAVYIRLWRIAPCLAVGAGSAHVQLETLVRGELLRRRTGTG